MKKVMHRLYVGKLIAFTIYRDIPHGIHFVA